MIWEREKESLFVTIFFLVFTKVGQAVADFTRFGAIDPMQLKWWVSGVWNLIGLALAIWFAGPLFGPVGYYLEYWGAGAFTEDPVSALFWLSVGALIIVAGNPAWRALKEVWRNDF